MPELVRQLALFPGMDGCALVEADTGMAWHYAGNWPDIERIGEAAVEFWRIQDRLQSHLAALGALHSAAYSFSNRVVALFPCSDTPRLILVCVAAKGNIQWHEWGKHALDLRNVLAHPVAKT